MAMSTGEWLRRKREQLSRLNDKNKENQGTPPGPVLSSSSTPISRGQMLVRASQKNNVLRNLQSNVRSRSVLSSHVDEEDERRNSVEQESNESEFLGNCQETQDTQQRSWEEVVSACGGVFISGNLGETEKEPEEEENTVEITTERDSAGENADCDNTDNLACQRTRKKKTPKEYRLAQPRVLAGADSKISKNSRKLFKEAFNTDKARLNKRQPKFKRERDFLLIMRDNIHEAGLEQSAQSAGKYMAFGVGKIKDQFLTDGIKYDKKDFVMHKNSHDFAVDKINVREEKESSPSDDSEDESPPVNSPVMSRNGRKKRKGSTITYPRKVRCPGVRASSDSESEED